MVSTTAIGEISSVSLFAHKLGHQFGAPHSWNTCTPFASQRSAATAYEIGSGTTIMSYNGLCGAENINAGQDLRFHSISLLNINNYLASAPSCAVNTANGNSVPAIDAGSGYTIPKFTPFTLTASANDADAADVPNLTYAWEQFDNGGTAYGNFQLTDAGNPADTTRPIFRAFSPTKSPQRTFPSLQYILNNQNDPPDSSPIIGEELPRVTRQIKFRVTARDNRSGGGGTNDDTVTLNVDGNSGPFGVTVPNTAVSWTGGTAQTVTWNVSGTNAAPVNTANVRILLSTDGGNTFSIVLLALTANDGNQLVTVPNGIATTTARVKIEAVGNIYFDISDQNFSIVNGDTCPIINSIAPAAGNAGTIVTLTGTGFTGVNAVRFSGSVSAASFNVVSDTQITAEVPTGATTGAITVSEPGCTDRQSSAFTVCAAAPTVLSVDTGTGGGWFSTRTNVNRLTPASYPATLTHVRLYFLNQGSNGLSVGNPIQVLAGATTTASVDGSITQRVATTVTATNTYISYPLPTPITITSGDFVVGFSVAAGINNFPASRDNATSSAGKSYVSFDDGATFSLYTQPNNFMIRAQISNNCSVPSTVSPGSQNFTAGGGTGSIAVTASGAFTAATNDAWIIVTGGASGNGSGNVTYSVAQNSTGALRTGTITVAGQTFTVTQEACSIGVSPGSLTVNSNGGSFTIAVSAPTGCAYTAASNNSWLTISSGASGTGDGTISFTVAPLGTTTARSGSLTINGQTFTVTQSGCPGSPIISAIDDGSVEASIDRRYVVNRLTPTSYPATLTQVQIYFDTGRTPASSAIQIVTGTNASAPAAFAPANIQLQTAASSATTGFTTYNLTSPVTISSGDFVVGFTIAGGIGTNPTQLDGSAPLDGRSYFSNNGGASFAIENNPFDYLIRAGYTLACSTVTSAAVSLGGRITSADGRAIVGARVRLINSDGNEQAVLTNPFGYFRFSDIPSGATYIIQPTHKRYSFTPQAVLALETVDDLFFISET